jgi:hypothetical protein
VSAIAAAALIGIAGGVIIFGTGCGVAEHHQYVNQLLDVNRMGCTSFTAGDRHQTCDDDGSTKNGLP